MIQSCDNDTFGEFFNYAFNLRKRKAVCFHSPIQNAVVNKEHGVFVTFSSNYYRERPHRRYVRIDPSLEHAFNFITHNLVVFWSHPPRGMLHGRII